MEAIFKRIKETGIIPVITISDADKAVPLAKALLAGGIPCAEVTLRTAQGEECIRRIRAEVPQILVGAGTVLTAEQARIAADAGAMFVVSPGFNPKVAAFCVNNGIHIIPGCSTPTEMEAAMELGIDVIKFFPAEQAGGLEYIKAVAAPYTGLGFIPTGGVNAGNLGKYMAFDRILACGGSWMASKELIDEGNYTEITRISREAVQIVRNARISETIAKGERL